MEGMESRPGAGKLASTSPPAEEPKLGTLSRLLEKHHLQQQEHFERLLLSHEQRIVESLGSRISEHCRQACEQTQALRGLGSMTECSPFLADDGQLLPLAVSKVDSQGFYQDSAEDADFIKRSRSSPSFRRTTMDDDPLRSSPSPSFRRTNLDEGRVGRATQREVVTEATLRKSLFRNSIARSGIIHDDPKSFSRCRASFKSIVGSRRFDNAMTGFTLLNALAIGVQVDWVVKNPFADVPFVFKVFDFSFAILFAIELFARLLCEGCSFFSYRNARCLWNYLDSLLVVVTLFDEITQLVWVKTLDIPSTKLVRMLRLARIVRVLRLVRQFRDLEIMVLGIMSTMKSLMWAMVLLSMIVFMFGSVFMDFVANELSTGRDAALRQALVDHFGTLWLTIFTLFKTITGGIDWDNAAAPLVSITPVLGILFCLYVGFSLFCVLNIITAVFVDHAKRISEKDEDRLVRTVLEARQQQIKEVTNLFRCLLNGKEEMTMDTFEDQLGNVAVQASFARLGIGIDEQNELFALLDMDMNGMVSEKEFVQGIHLLQASVTRADMDRMCRSHYSLQKQVQDLAEVCGALAYEQRVRNRAPPASEGPAGAEQSRVSSHTQPTTDVVHKKEEDLPLLKREVPAGFVDPMASLAFNMTAATAAVVTAEAALAAAAAEADPDLLDDDSCSAQADPQLPGTIKDEPQFLS